MSFESLEDLLQESARQHEHLCPRQVLGVRMGMLAAELLGLALPLPRSDKRLLTIVETDGCFADGVSVATGCWVGHRTLRIVDYGKIAATFVDVPAETAIRVVPQASARERASDYAPEIQDRWQAYLVGYGRMPFDELFTFQSIELAQDVRTIVSNPNARAVCDVCEEEIFNGREVLRAGRIVCRACAGQAYYRGPLNGGRGPGSNRP